MAYCGWPVNVNKIILDSTSVNVGTGATVKDELEAGGLAKSRLTCSNPPDKFNVVMEFDFSQKQYDGYTELENFWAWYKTVHKFGTVPFQFPAILINSNRQQGYSTEDVSYGKVPDTEYYCITSAIDGSKSGLCQQVSMTWETYATGTIQVEEEDFGITYIKANNGTVEVVLTSTPDYEPNSGQWDVRCTKSETGATVSLIITGCLFDGDRTATLFFTPLTAKGTYIISVDGKTNSFMVT